MGLRPASVRSAAVAGLQAGDILRALDGTPAASRTLDALRRQLRELPAGQDVALHVEREGVLFETTLRLRDLIPGARTPGIH